MLPLVCFPGLAKHRGARQTENNTPGCNLEGDGMELIKASNESVEGNEAIRQINIELVKNEIARLGKHISHEMSMDRYEDIDELQDEIDELENTLDDLLN